MAADAVFQEQAIFGSGRLYGVGGDTLSTPTEFGTLQDVSIDFSLTKKELRGQNLFPEKIGRAEAKITGKAKMGRINPVLFKQLFFDFGTMATGRELLAAGEAASVPAATPFTVVASNGANFKTDLGVKDANTGAVFEKVAAGSEVQGAYSVDPSTGTYTFSTDDQGRAVLISYTYSDTSGHTLSVGNTLAGVASTFQIIVWNEDDGGKHGIRLYACSSDKLAFATKKGDFNIPELDFAAQADPAGKVFDEWFE